MKNFILLLMLCILFVCCKKQNAQPLKNNYVDSLLVIANKTNDNKQKLKFADKIYLDLEEKKLDSVSRKQFIELTRIYYSVNNPRYIEICKLILSNPDTKFNHNEISFYSFLLGNYFYNSTNYVDAFFYYSKAEKSFNEIDNLEYVSFSNAFKANILLYKKDYLGAEKLIIKALKIAVQKENNELIYNCYLTLGNTSLGYNNYNKANEYFKKAIIVNDKLTGNANHFAFSVQTLNYISTVYQRKKEYNNSIKFAQQGLNFDEIRSKEINIYCYLTNNLAYSKFKLGDKNSYLQFLETLKIGDSLKFAPIQITSKTYLGEYYLTEKDTTKANFYFKDAQSQAHKNDIFEDELKILQLLAKANPNDKSFYSNRYIALNDSLQTVERATRDKFARIEFETDEITAEKNTLSVEKNHVEMQRYLIAGISILSLLIIFLWYRTKLQKAKTRELLLQQEQQKASEEIYQLMLDQQQKIEEGKNIEKQRISQELHDGVMGRLSGIRMNLFVLNKKTDPETIAKCLEYIKEIQSIEKEIRTIAHDLNNNLFSDTIHFQSIVQNLFTSIQNHSDIEFNLKVDEKINWEIVPNATKISVYRIIQEALQNIDKYAQATHVTIQMDLQENTIAIAIKDNGIGFIVNSKKTGIGLTNMQTRMQEIKGDFKIESQLNKGTKINLKIPI